MVKIKIHDLRMTFIWTRTLLDLLKGNAPRTGPMAFLGDESLYKATFANLHINGDPLTPPWCKPTDDYFWTYYMEGTEPKDVTAARAWKQLVPLRRKVDASVARITAGWFPGRLYLEAFFYPHGIALVFTAVCKTEFYLQQAREVSFKIRQDELLEFQPAGAPVEKLHLNSLAGKTLDLLCMLSLGPGHLVPAPAIKPFSIWTVVRGEGVEPTAPLSQGKEVHRILEAVTTWNPNFATAMLPSLADAQHSARLRSKRSAGDILYANDRGRAIWFPGTFTLSPGKRRSLACYHRNLVYASMQVESLSRFVRDTSAEIQQPGDASKLPLPQFYCARRATGILSRLYAAVEDKTYRSGSPYLQIRQNNFLDAINNVREEILDDPTPLA